MENYVDPDKVRFCQSSIKDCFRGPGGNAGENLLSVFIKLYEGKLTPEKMKGRVEAYVLQQKDLERIRREAKNNSNLPVNCEYAVEGNRRLYLFKKLKEAGKLQKEVIPYKSLHSLGNDAKKFTTKTQGESIKLRVSLRDPDGSTVESRINRIVRDKNIQPSDRTFPNTYQKQGMVIVPNSVQAAGVDVAHSSDDEDDIYYESDDDGQ